MSRTQEKTDRQSTYHSRPSFLERGLEGKLFASNDAGAIPDTDKSSHPTLLKGEIVIITTQEFVVEMKIRKRQTYKGAKLIIVNSWGELAEELQKYKTIQRLILCFHGGPGALKIGRQYEDLNEVKKYFDKKIPFVKQINFESCNVGRDPVLIIPFANLFKASKITAWNHFTVSIIQKVKVNKDINKTRTELELTMKRFKGYFAPGTPTIDELIKRPAGEYLLLVEWFRDDFNNTVLPPPNPLGLDNRIYKFKPRSSAKLRTIAPGMASTWKEKYQDVIIPLEQIIIEFGR